MIKRCVEISEGPAHLSLRDNQLVLTREDEELRRVPIEDLGVLVVDHPASRYTHGALTAMMANNVAVVLCAANHNPVGMLLPLEGHSLQAEALAAQAAAGDAVKKRLWKEIVRAKVIGQAVLLERRGQEAGAFRQLAARVKSGDPENIEARAAQRYWRLLLGGDFRRGRAGPPPNNLLNYGYMVLRAATARAVCGAGLSPSLGLHHRNKYNAFVLADDLMEPMRPCVDRVVAELWDKGEGLISPETRAALLGVLAQPVDWKGVHSPLFVALQRYAASVREVLVGKLARPHIPTILAAEDGEA